MQNTPQRQYKKILLEVKEAETIILLTTDLVLSDETLTKEGKKRLTEIKKQVRRIDRLLEKVK